MPPTSSRMSASSSTTRMSAAISGLAHCVLRLNIGWFGLPWTTRCKSEPHPGPPPAGRDRRRVVELDPAAMLLEDALHDGEPEAGAFLPGRHIRFEQSIAIFLRQADAVIDYVDHNVVPLIARGDVHHAPAELVRRNRADR